MAKLRNNNDHIQQTGRQRKSDHPEVASILEIARFRAGFVDTGFL